MRKFADWLASWWTTWRLKRENPALYKRLCDIIENSSPEDFVEVPTEGPVKLRIHKDAVETLRRLGEESHPSSEL